MTNGRSTIYLNNAATAWPRAPGVAEAVKEALERLPAEAHRSSGEDEKIPAECRRLLAHLLGVEDNNRIVFTSGATSALNLAFLGLDLRGGDRVITSVSEHNSVLRPLSHLQRDLKVEVEIVGLDAQGRLDEEAFGRALERGARLVVLNHVSNVTGDVNPVGTFFGMARKTGATTLLDASQSLGIHPVRPAELNAELVAFTGHKGLRAPPGTGGLWVAPGLELRQVIVGGTGIWSDRPLHPDKMPMRLEAGTPNLPALAGLEVALRWHTRVAPQLHTVESALGGRLRQGLRQIHGVQVYQAQPGNALGSVVSFSLEGWDTGEAGHALRDSFGIVCRTGLHCAPLMHEALGSAPGGTIRFSLSGMNTEAEINGALDAVDRLVA